MVRFMSDAKRLHGMLEKAVFAISRGANAAGLDKIWLQLDEEGILHVFPRGPERSIEIRSRCVQTISSGGIRIDGSVRKVIRHRLTPPDAAAGIEVDSVQDS